MKKYDVFISFSSKDLKYVRQLMASLQYQGITFWDYSNDIEQIELGENLPDYLFKQIDNSKYFIPLISRDSVDKDSGRFTRLEVEYILKNAGQSSKNVIPLMIKNKCPRCLEGPFKSFENKIYLHMNFIDEKGYEEAIGRICEKVYERNIHKKYKPIIETHERMPFWKKFKEESFQFTHSNAAHVELMIILSLFNTKFQQEAWEEAYFLIRYFLDSCAYKIPESAGGKNRLFYPYIVKGVCEQILGDWDQAEQTFKQAGRIRRGHRYVHGGLGGVYSDRGDYEKAIDHYRMALEQCKTDNTDEKINYATILIKADNPVPVTLKTEILQYTLQIIPGHDWYTVLKLQAVILFLDEQYREAEQKFNQLDNMRDTMDEDAEIYYYYCLLYLDKKDEAFQRLISKGCYESNPELLAFKGKQLFRFREFDQAIQIFEKLNTDPETVTRETLIIQARIFRQLENHEKMKELCKRVISDAGLSLPQTKKDFYFTGFANYLLDELERARYDFERSEAFDDYYNQFPV
ncbi:toll/interleukin-1 receptor domain-containing protein [bacterium]|nr:toll/interleukin-1 receptor domain-containing protein [bacterium]